jgi:hypothetical protein
MKLLEKYAAATVKLRCADRNAGTEVKRLSQQTLDYYLRKIKASSHKKTPSDVRTPSNDESYLNERCVHHMITFT